MWKASQDEIITCDHSQKRGTFLFNRCAKCKDVLETTEYLLLHCPFARNLWELARSHLGLHLVVPGMLKHQLRAWEVLFW